MIFPRFTGTYKRLLWVYMTRLSCYSELVLKRLRDRFEFQEMNLAIRSLILLTLFLLINNDKKTSVEASGAIANLARDFIQFNIAGLPSTHRKTEWNFDPEIGKKRRVTYEEINGHRGELAIARLGMGIGYAGPWGTEVEHKDDA